MLGKTKVIQVHTTRDFKVLLRNKYFVVKFRLRIMTAMKYLITNIKHSGGYTYRAAN